MNLRVRYFLLVIVTVVLGLGSRIPAVSSVFGFWLGDVLYATMVYWWVGVIQPKTVKGIKALWALTFTFLIEFSQMLKADWLLELRSYRLGALVLGHGFLWSDLGLYILGVLLAALIDYYWIKPITILGR